MKKVKPTKRITGEVRQQERDRILSKILSAYRKVLKENEKPNRKASSRLADAKRALTAAFGKLPESAKKSKPDVTAMEFGKLLSEKPKSPKFLKSQSSFIEE